MELIEAIWGTDVRKHPRRKQTFVQFRIVMRFDMGQYICGFVAVHLLQSLTYTYFITIVYMITLYIVIAIASIHYDKTQLKHLSMIHSHYAYSFTFIFIYMHNHLHAYSSTFKFIYMHIHLHGYLFTCSSSVCIFITCIFISMHLQWYEYSLICIFIYMHIQWYEYSLICIFIYVHIHIHLLLIVSSNTPILSLPIYNLFMTITSYLFITIPIYSIYITPAISTALPI